MSFFSDAWAWFTQPIVESVKIGAEIIEYVGDHGDAIVEAVTDTVTEIFEPIPVLGEFVGEVMDDIKFNHDLMTDVQETYAQATASMVELGQFVGKDVLDPEVDNMDAAAAQHDIVTESTMDFTWGAIEDSFNSWFSW